MTSTPEWRLHETSDSEIERHDQEVDDALVEEHRLLRSELASIMFVVVILIIRHFWLL